MHRQLRLLIALTVWIVGLVAVRLIAQGGLGSITGTVLDQTGGILPGASIQIVETSTGSARTGVSNEAGLFNVPSLPAGTYDVTLSLQNFKTRKFEKLTLNSFQQLSLGQITLELSVGATDMVEVSASTTPLEIDNTIDDPIYRTYRGNVGNVTQDQRVLSYALPTSTATRVDLRLHFAERASGNNAAGRRLFDISAEGALLVHNFDIFATAGGLNKAYVLALDNIAVSDGTLNLVLKASVDYPSIAGIEVFCRTGC